MGANHSLNKENKKRNKTKIIKKDKKDDLNKIKPNEVLINIKSKYILQLLLSYLKKPKDLKIIKYNKKIHQKLGIDSNYYKEYIEKFSNIELEIIPLKNKYGKFINILNNEEKPFYHIYFNEKEEEIKREYLDEYLDKNEKIEKIRVILNYQKKSFYKLFDDCKYIEFIYFKKSFRKDINNTSYMFSGCTSLKEIKFNDFNTSNVNSMNNMFSRCSSLKELDLSHFNTEQVTNMSCMFSGCSSLIQLNLSNFNTSNVTNMNSMFSGCPFLQELNISNFNTNNVTNMRNMFYECRSLEKLNVSKFNTNNVTDMSYIFCACASLKELNLSNFNTEKVVDMSFMFSRCTSLVNLNISNFNFSNVEDMNRMFIRCQDELIKEIQKKYKSIREEAFEKKIFSNYFAN